MPRKSADGTSTEKPERWSGKIRNCEPIGDVHLNPEKRSRLIIKKLVTAILKNAEVRKRYRLHY